MSASHLWNVYCVNLTFGPCQKNDIFGYIWPRSLIQMVKCSLLDKKDVYQSFYGVPHTFRYSVFFTSRKSSVFHTCQQVTFEKFISKVFRRPCWKTFICSYLWHKSFIQTVRCSFLNHINIISMAHCSRLFIFYFKEKFCVSACVGEMFWRPCQKNYISGSIWHESFIQMVKYSFPNERIVYQSVLNINIISKRLLRSG